MKLFIIPSLYPVSGAALYPHFDIYLIYLNKDFPILHSEMPYKLEVTLMVLILEKELASGYSIIIAKVFESMLESWDMYIKFKVLNNKYEGKTVEFIVSSYIENNLVFIAIR